MDIDLEGCRHISSIDHYQLGQLNLKELWMFEQLRNDLNNIDFEMLKKNEKDRLKNYYGGDYV